MTPARSEEVAAEFVRKHYGIGMTAGHWAEKIAALLQRREAEVREDALEWVRAFARDCGCAERIEKAIRASAGEGKR